MIRPTPEMWASVQAQIVALANAEHPKEACGFVFVEGLDTLRVERCDNVADWPYAQFRIRLEDAELAFRSGRCVAMWHSHPEEPAVPSGLDEELALEELYFLVYAVADEDLGVFRKINGRLEPLVYVQPS